MHLACTSVKYIYVFLCIFLFFVPACSIMFFIVYRGVLRGKVIKSKKCYRKNKSM